MDLRQLGYVVAIVEEGSFTGAAARMGISQPSLSHAVKALENELGAHLFNRLPRSVTLTAAGEALLGPARQALRDAAVARAAVDEVIGLRAGRLDLVCLPTVAVHPVADLVGRFRTRHPDVRVRIDEPEDADAVADAVRHGTSELGIAELPVRAPELESIELERHEFVAVLPRTGAATATIDVGETVRDEAGDESGPDVEQPASLRDLASLPLITTPRGTSTRRQVDEAFTAAGISPTIAVETDHREAIISLVLAGAGIAIVPAPLAAATREHGAVVRRIVPAIVRRIGLIRRPGPLSPAAQAFVALAIPGAPVAPPRPSARRRPRSATLAKTPKTSKTSTARVAGRQHR
jgi:LysR family carnitine catabolism transcriptional activator